MKHYICGLNVDNSILVQLLTLSSHLQYIGVGDLCSVYSASCCMTAGIGSSPCPRTLKWISG